MTTQSETEGQHTTDMATGFCARFTVPEGKALVSALRTMVGKAPVKTDDQGRCRALVVHPSHVMMLEATFPAVGSVDSGIDLEKLHSYLQKCTVKDNVRLSADPAGFMLENLAGIKRSMPFVDPMSLPVPKIPSLNLPRAAVVDQKAVLAVLKHCGDVSDHIEIVIEGDDLVIRARGEFDVVEKRFTDAVATDGGDDPLRSLYSLDYFTDIVKATDGSLKIDLWTDYPMLVSWSVGDMDFRAWLAPRLEARDPADPEPSSKAPPATQGDAEATDGPAPAPEATEGLEEAVLEIIRDLDDGDGAKWDEIVARFPADQDDAVEESINTLMDQGWVYEPSLGIIKVC